MSTPEPRFADDVKVATPLHGDVEQGAPPSYPLNESEELVVGGQNSRCNRWRIFRRNRHCGHRAENQGRGRKFIRVVKWLLAGWLLLSVVHFAVAGVRFHKAFKTMKCVAITPANASHGVDYTIPLAHSTSGVLVHDSLSGGDTLITHDSSVKDGTVQVSLKFSDNTEQDKVFDGCMAKFRRGTAVGLIPRERHGARADIKSFVLRFPTSVSAPGVHMIGGGSKHVSDKKLRKLIRWWRKHHEKKSVNNLDLE